MTASSLESAGLETGLRYFKQNALNSSTTWLLRKDGWVNTAMRCKASRWLRRLAEEAEWEVCCWETWRTNSLLKSPRRSTVVHPFKAMLSLNEMISNEVCFGNEALLNANNTLKMQHPVILKLNYLVFIAMAGVTTMAGVTLLISLSTRSRTRSIFDYRSQIAEFNPSYVRYLTRAAIFLVFISTRLYMRLGRRIPSRSSSGCRTTLKRLFATSHRATWGCRLLFTATRLPFKASDWKRLMTQCQTMFKKRAFMVHEYG